MEGIPALIPLAPKGPNREAKWYVCSLKLPLATIECVKPCEAGTGFGVSLLHQEA